MKHQQNLSTARVSVDSGASGLLPAFVSNKTHLPLHLIFTLPNFPSNFHLIYIQIYWFTHSVGFIMSVTNVLMRRGTELAVTHVQSGKLEHQQPNEGLVALFAITAILIGIGFWAVSQK